MDINRSRFATDVLDIIENICNSHFIAFDLEFTGVAERRQRDRGRKLTLQEVYDDVREAAKRYQTLQIGFTIVQEDLEKGCYLVRPYNFSISPIPALKERIFGRVWSAHSGAIDFLLRNGFDFDSPLKKGIPYLSRQEEEDARDAWIREDTKRVELADLEIKEQDYPLVEHIRDSISKWLEQKNESHLHYLNIPSEIPPKGIPERLNRYQMRIIHQVVRKEYPKLKTVGMKDFVQVTNPTGEQQENEKASNARYRDREIGKAIGLRWLIEAIIGNDLSQLPDEYLISAVPRNIKPEQEEPPLKAYLRQLQEKLQTRRKVLVGHNCFTDLVNFYACFIGDPPQSLEDFIDQIHSLFPAVIDTKFLASFGNKWAPTALEDVERDMRAQITPSIEIPSEFDRYELSEKYHEAGFDSLMTAKVMIKLSAKLYKERAFEIPLSRGRASTAFGQDDGEGYVTASESLSEIESRPESIITKVVKVLSNPISKIKENKEVGSPANATPPYGEDGESVDPRNEQNDRGSKGLVVRQKLVDRSRPPDNKKGKAAFASSNLFNVLLERSGRSNDRADDSSTDFWEVSSEDENMDPPPKMKSIGGHKQRRKKVSEMVKQGEMMPQWDDDLGFWEVFGNRLQVNSSQEGTCQLC